MAFFLKTLTILFYLTCLLSLSSAANYRKYYCDNNNRPNINDCFNDNPEYQPTCGYYKNNCPFKLCAQSTSNACHACSNPDVLYYEKHECEPEKTVNQCFPDMCNPDFDDQQAKVYEPVCGYRRGCKSGDCSRTFDNVCKACENSRYPWYQNGVCQDDRYSCKSRNNYLRSSKSQVVCAFFDTEDGGVEQHTTVANARTACSDSAVKYYAKGKCGLGRDGTVYCLPNERPQACTREYNPVCGFYLDDDQILRHKILSNPCTACADESVIYHQPGPCVFKCNRNPNIIFECDGVTVDPVCGSYEENGETKRISLKNGCIGCYNIPTKIDSYTDGLCPGDEGIRCENDAGGFLVGRIFPVCGVFREGCSRSSCRQTFSESIEACRDSNVILYKPGPCPGDEGISCRPYRTHPDDSNVYAPTYQNVCGYTRKGCRSSSCRRNYDDQYAACGRSSVQFFTEGPCP